MNLLTPAADRAERQRVRRERRWRRAGFGCAVVYAGVICGSFYHLHTIHTDLIGRRLAAADELGRLRELARLIETDQATLKETARRREVVERLETRRHVVSRLLESLGQIVPDDVWLLEVKEAGSAVQVDGRALSVDAIIAFKDRLQQAVTSGHPAEILAVATETLDGQRLVRFALKAVLGPLDLNSAP